MSESQRPHRFPRIDYSQLHNLGFDLERLEQTANSPQDESRPDDSSGSGDEFIAEPSDNETSEDQANSQVDSQVGLRMGSQMSSQRGSQRSSQTESQNISSSFEQGKTYHIPCYYYANIL